jgi:hypothetical protein
MRRKSLNPPRLAAGLLAFAIFCGAPMVTAMAEPPAVAWSSADSLLVLLNTPETFDVLRKHIPFFVNLTEHGLIPAFSTQMTLDDLLNAPATQVTAEHIAAINAELARLPAPPR